MSFATNENPKVSFVAGGAGFIGTSLVKKLISRGDVVYVADNFSLGSRELFEKTFLDNSITILEADLSVSEDVSNVFDYIFNERTKIDEVWHLAANSDISSGVKDPSIDLKDTFMTTYEILKACSAYSVPKFNFASSSAVYGDWGSQPLIETMGPLRPISNYGAMKLASEAQICSAKESFLKQANIFRFPNVVGAPATHGVIFDLIDKLKESPLKLEVLGDGTQRKSYLHVTDLTDAMIFVSDAEIDHTQPTIVNIGCDDEGVTVRAIAEMIVRRCSPKAEIFFGDEERGWVGDVPRFKYDTSQLKGFGWLPKMNSNEAIERAINEIAKEKNILF